MRVAYAVRNFFHSLFSAEERPSASSSVVLSRARSFAGSLAWSQRLALSDALIMNGVANVVRTDTAMMTG